MNARLRVGLVVGFALLVPAGCAGDPVGRTVPVKGKVTVNGQPLKQGSVTFWPDDAKGNKLAFEPGGSIASDGSYELFTHGKPGAPPGAYKVTVTAQTVVDSTKPTTAKQLVPEQYTTKDKTKLGIDVVENPAAGAYDLNLK
jgi:hypothetical protein